MTIRMTGKTPDTNQPRDLSIELQGDEVHVAVRAPGGAGYLVRVPRDAFEAEMRAFLAACQPAAAEGAAAASDAQTAE